MSTVGGSWSRPKIINDGLVLYLDASTSNSYSQYFTPTTWKDLSGNNNSGSLVNGPTFNPLNGGSIVFNGSNNSISRTSIDTGQNFTTSAWINPTLLGTTRRAIVGNSYPYSGRVGWLFCTAGGNINNTFFLSIGGDTRVTGAPANTLATNTWQYVTAVVTNGGETITLYKNGQQVATSTGSTGTILYTNSQFYIGRRYSATNDYYTGGISQVQIYNRALSATEVLQNYNATRTRYNL